MVVGERRISTTSSDALFSASPHGDSHRTANGCDEQVNFPKDLAHKRGDKARGLSANDVALFMSIDPVTVSRYVHRFHDGGVNTLLSDRSRKPGKRPVSEEVKNKITRVACPEKPVDATHWSIREPAKRFRIELATLNISFPPIIRG